MQFSREYSIPFCIHGWHDLKLDYLEDWYLAALRREETRDRQTAKRKAVIKELQRYFWVLKAYEAGSDVSKEAYIPHIPSECPYGHQRDCAKRCGGLEGSQKPCLANLTDGQNPLVQQAVMMTRLIQREFEQELLWNYDSVWKHRYSGTLKGKYKAPEFSRLPVLVKVAMMLRLKEVVKEYA